MQKKLGTVSQKLAAQPRNVIAKEDLFNGIKQIRTDIDGLDRFFKEHAIHSLNNSLQSAVEGMKEYFRYQKNAVKEVQSSFQKLKNDLLGQFSSITTKDKVLSIKEVAKYLGISYSTVQSMMFMHGLPYIKIGNRYRIRENDLKVWLNKHKEERQKSECFA